MENENELLELILADDLSSLKLGCAILANESLEVRKRVFHTVLNRLMHGIRKISFEFIGNWKCHFYGPYYAAVTLMFGDNSFHTHINLNDGDFFEVEGFTLITSFRHKLDIDAGYEYWCALVCDTETTLSYILE
jgi:hypothetical protein